ncbi:extracellular solute-binding protein [Paenibacillus radicis (ex Xue et al. 2023)]|uniref:Extracellular solute-binding protein n=1 Tax=Paenibacillus radicis (ex Xue et al. 2023) TaxID=2972489 RepID=A0ABT1YFA7_9BACL|nr:extracellular solute-binding protein [Paenibacillus radicis (ex Xue et al. 2023)]MCR8630913.1 extracellular solute-binding protein [Paenibacillus radicis (ex Xue et al. 2023)]
MKKAVTSLTLSSMLLLAACGGGAPATTSAGKTDTPTNNDKKPAETKAADASKAGEKKTLEFWYIDPGDKEKVYLEAVERFKKKHPNVEVKALQTPNDTYKQKFAVAMSGGNPPDVFHSWGGGWLKEFVTQGNVLDITGKIDANSYVKTVLDNATFNGKNYGVPLGLSVTMVWYNKDIFAKYGIKQPATWEEFMTVIDTLKQNKLIPFTLANQPKWPGAYYFMYLADRVAGPELFKSALGRTGKTFDDDGYVQAGKLIQDLVKRDAFNKGFNGIPWDAGQGRQILYTEQAAMLVMSNSIVNNVRTEAPTFEKKLDFFPFPTVPGGKGDPSDIGGASAPVWSVSAKTKNPDLAIELIKELSSQETAQNYSDRTGSPVGVKGVTYKDEFAKRLGVYVDKAKDIHWPYDQTLPPDLAELHKDTTQAIFGLSMTPEEAAKKMEEKAKQILK